MSEISNIKWLDVAAQQCARAEDSLRSSGRGPSVGLEDPYAFVLPLFPLKNLRNVVASILTLLVGFGSSVGPEIQAYEQQTYHNIAESFKGSDKFVTPLETADQAMNHLWRFSMGFGFYGETTGVTQHTEIWHLFQVANAFRIASLLPNSDGSAQAELDLIIRASDAYWEDAQDGFGKGYDPSVNRLPGQTPERYVDDNLWFGLLLADEYTKNGNEAYLYRASQIMELAMSQWNLTEGGIYWKVQYPGENNHDLALVSNMPAASLAAKLYLLTHNPKYAVFAESIFDWAHNRLFDPDTGLYSDKIQKDDSIDKTVFTYGQGVAIEALMTLNKINPTKYPIQMAIDLAEKSMDYFSHKSRLGIMKFDVIYLEQLMKLAGQLDDLDYTKKIVIFQGQIMKSLPEDPPTTVAESAAQAAILILCELPTDLWGNL